MVAIASSRRRTRRSGLRKVSLLLLTFGLLVVSGVGFLILARATLQPEQTVIVDAVLATATPEPYRPVPSDRSLPPMYPEPLEITLGPRTAQSVTLRLGPSEDYVALGTLQADAPLKAVGRNDEGDWVAVVFPPGSTFQAWLPVSQTLEVENVDDLPVQPVNYLP